jgi:hypothetical protein
VDLHRAAAAKIAVTRFKISTSSRSLRFSSLAPAARAPVNPPLSPNAVAAMTAIARIASGALVGRRPLPGELSVTSST